MCKHWREYDQDNGSCYEFCKADNKTTYCCGTEKQCLNGKYQLEDSDQDLKATN